MKWNSSKLLALALSATVAFNAYSSTVLAKNIPLDDEVKSYVSEVCKEYSVPESLVYALIETESNFKADAISKTNDYGLMQINKVNHKWLADKLNITNFLDSKQNILAGVYMLSDHISRADTLDKAIMIYSLGIAKATSFFKQGVFSTRYSRNLLNLAKEYTHEQ